MAQVFPFRAYRFNPELAPFDRLLTQPYDKISPERQAEYYAMHPQNLIAVEKGLVYPDDSPQNNVYTRAAAKVDEIEIAWPSGIKQAVRENLTPNGSIEITERAAQ